MLRRQQFNPAATDARLLSVDRFKLAFSADVRGTGLYLDAGRKQLAVIAEGVADRATYDAWFAPQAWSQGVTEVALIDASSPTQMQQRRLLRWTAAQLIGSRRLGATLYLVLRRATRRCPVLTRLFTRQRQKLPPTGSAGYAASLPIAADIVD